MHIPVLLKEVLSGLVIKRGEIFLDCTAGSGGHCGAVCRQLGSSVKIIAIDQDEDLFKSFSSYLHISVNKK